MPLEAHRPHLLERDRLAVDQRRHARAGRRLGGIVEHVLDRGGVLEPAKHLARRLAALGVAQVGGQVLPHVVELHARGRQMTLALDDDELVGHLDHRRDLAGLEREGGVVELRLSRVQPDRLHPAVGAGTADVHGVAAGEAGKVVRGGHRPGPQVVGFLAGAGDDDPGLHGGAELLLVRLLNLLGRGLGGAGRQPPQGEHRPHDVVGVLPRRNAPLPLDQLHVLVLRHVEPPRHGVDLGVDVLG